ncbi:hypothetical protein ACQP2E_19940 [Actinoplanes sp. CA-015351]|uniref:hypothetical protein n=1 Tax=Actinoplanes sp. CA-015351 TaxID=3239897 RepID=UPI003D986490
MEAEPQPAGFLTHARELANIVAPVTLVTALLLYFGYIGTRARLEYFGVYLDMTGLSNQDLVMSGLEVVYFPAAMIFLALLAGALVHGVVTWLLSAPHRDRETLVVAAITVTLGVLAIGRALIGLFNVEVSRVETPGTTPLALALGPLLVFYGVWIGWRVVQRQAAPDSRLLTWHASPPVRQVRLAALAAVAGLLVVGLFWAANSFAWAFGTGRAYEEAGNLANRPELIIDTKDRLAEPPAGVTETPLPGDGFTYRYTGLRLLIEADGRLYLVPAPWTVTSKTLIIAFDDEIRVQLIP